MLRACLAALAAAFLAFPVTAKNLGDATGIGAALPDWNGVAILSVRHAVTPYYLVSVGSGFDSDTTRKLFILGGKIYRQVHLEENVNVALGVGAQYLNSVAASGWEVDALLAFEAFLSGIPRLGLLFETGVGVRKLGETSLRSLGSGFLGFGIHYYF